MVACRPSMRAMTSPIWAMTSVAALASAWVASTLATISSWRGRSAGQFLDLPGDDGEALAHLPGARRFDGRVQREQVGLLGDGGDELDDVTDLISRLERPSRSIVSPASWAALTAVAAVAEASAVEAAISRMAAVISSPRGDGADVGGDLLGGRGDDLRLRRGLRRPAGQLRGHGRQLLAGAGEGGGVVGDLRHDRAQPLDRGVRRGREATHLVAGGVLHPQVQTALREPLDDHEGLRERPGDGAADGDGGATARRRAGPGPPGRTGPGRPGGRRRRRRWPSSPRPPSRSRRGRRRRRRAPGRPGSPSRCGR